MNRKSYVIAVIVLAGVIWTAEAEARVGASISHKGFSLVIGSPKLHSRLSIVSPIRSSYRHGHGRSLGRGHSVIRRPAVVYRSSVVRRPAVVHTPVVRRPAVVHTPVVRRPAIIHAPVVHHCPPTVVVQRPEPVRVQETTITVWISNSNGSKSSVVLIQEGLWYIGPRGERYYGMPTESQLRMVYGL